MTKVLRRLAALLLTLLLVIGTAAAELVLLPETDALLSAPYTALLSVQTERHMPFDDEGTSRLNGLLKHMSLRLDAGGNALSRMALLVDGEEAAVLTEKKTSAGSEVLLSTQPGMLYTHETDAVSALLGSEAGLSAFGLTAEDWQRVEDARTMLNAVSEALKDYRKDTAIKTSVQDMGVARQKQVCTVPAADAQQLGGMLTALCPEGAFRQLMASLTFTGKQTFTLYRDADGRLLRVQYAGQCTPEGGKKRDVSLTWRMCANDSAVRDELTLRTPATNGGERDNVIISRALTVTKKGNVSLKMSLKLDLLKGGNQKTVIEGKADLLNTVGKQKSVLSGEMSLTAQLPGASSSQALILAPSLTFSREDASCTGTLTVSEKSGKNVTEKAAITVDVRPRDLAIEWNEPETVTYCDLNKEASGTLTESVLRRFTRTLLPRLILLPAEDTLFLSEDIPADTWQQIVDAAKAAMENGR